MDPFLPKTECFGHYCHQQQTADEAKHETTNEKHYSSDSRMDVAVACQMGVFGAPMVNGVREDSGCVAGREGQ